MLQVRRFVSFTDIQDTWIALEKQTSYYPFQSFWYQQLFAREFCRKDDVYLLGVYQEKTVLAVGGFEKIEDTIVLLGMKQVLGGQDLTDYGDLLFHPSVAGHQIQEIWNCLTAYFQQEHVSHIQLDFVRENSPTYTAFHANPKSEVVKQEVSPYIVVPDSWDTYLSSLSRKERHELRRKMKRFEEQDAFHFCSDVTIKQDFDDFIRLHRLSDSAKEKFMSEKMKQFFWEIVSSPKTDYRVDFCFLEIERRRVASIMSLIGQNKALLYNSGFDPAYSYYSVGLILHAYLVKKSIEEKLQVHDFLRGNERYKYDLGANDMQLYKIVIPLR